MELLRARKIEQKAFAKEIGVTESIVSEWKSGKTKSYLKYLPRIAKYLDVPVDELLGLATSVRGEPLSLTTIQIITGLLKERGISAAKMSKDLGFSNAVFYQWKKGEQSPSLTKVSAIANYFDVPIECLLGTAPPQVSVGDISNNGHNVIGVGDNSPVSIVPDVKTASNKQEEDLLRIFKMLDGKGQHKLMSIAYGLEEEISKS